MNALFAVAVSIVATPATSYVPSCACAAFLPAYVQAPPATPAALFGSWPDHRRHEPHAEEAHLRNLLQLTFGGQNAEAYWNLDGSKLIYQSRQPIYPDEQIFTMNADGSNKRLVSTGLGRCTCAYYLPDGSGILFSSTHARNVGAQPAVDMSRGYVWMVNPNFELYRADNDGGNPRKILDLPGYVAETTVSPDGSYMVFTSDFEGDLQIYRAALDGSNLKRLTNEEGYDGGPFVSWDGKKIVYRRSTPMDEAALADYKSLLAQHLVRPNKLEVWIMDADGSNKRQVTNLNAASFAPFLHPDGKRIIFSSNYGDTRGREFDLWMIHVDGTGLKRITHTPDFDGFPMFSRDGKKLVWASNRFGSTQGETNVFVADWVD